MQDHSTIKQFTNLCLERTLGARGALDSIDLVKNAVIETALTDAYAALERAEDHLRRALVLLKEEVVVMPRLETVALIASLALAAGMVIYVQFFAFIEVPL